MYANKLDKLGKMDKFPETHVAKIDSRKNRRLEQNYTK